MAVTTRQARKPVIAFAALWAVTLMALAGPAPFDAAHAAESVTVHLDRAMVIKLPERTATLVIGNPLIADAMVQPGGVAVITAKSYGATNLIALDSAGATLVDHPVQVVGPADRIVVVYRGLERESYSCDPMCERRLTLGDTPNYFTANLTQLGNFASQAQGQK